MERVPNPEAPSIVWVKTETDYMKIIHCTQEGITGIEKTKSAFQILFHNTHALEQYHSSHPWQFEDV